MCLFNWANEASPLHISSKMTKASSTAPVTKVKEVEVVSKAYPSLLLVSMAVARSPRPSVSYFLVISKSAPALNS